MVGAFSYAVVDLRARSIKTSSLQAAGDGVTNGRPAWPALALPLLQCERIFAASVLRSYPQLGFSLMARSGASRSPSNRLPSVSIPRPLVLWPATLARELTPAAVITHHTAHDASSNAVSRWISAGDQSHRLLPLAIPKRYVTRLPAKICFRTPARSLSPSSTAMVSHQLCSRAPCLCPRDHVIGRPLQNWQRSSVPRKT